MRIGSPNSNTDEIRPNEKEVKTFYSKERASDRNVHEILTFEFVKKGFPFKAPVSLNPKVYQKKQEERALYSLAFPSMCSLLMKKQRKQ